MQQQDIAIDIYIDGFYSAIGPFDSSVQYFRSAPPRQPGQSEIAPTIVNIRQSKAHSMLEVFKRWELINNEEEGSGERTKVSEVILFANAINMAKWNAFWNITAPQEVTDIGTIQPNVAQPVQVNVGPVTPLTT